MKKLPIALALGLLLPGPMARAQDEKPPEKKAPEGDGLGGDEKAVTEEQLRLCPELRGAFGRRKAQLLAIHFELDEESLGADATRKRVVELFDLSRAEDRELLEKALAVKGPPRALGGVRVVVALSGAKGLTWALAAFEKGPDEVRGRLLESLVLHPSREATRFLVRCLGDTRPVPDVRASREAPPGYVALRVCDHALRALGSRSLRDESLALPDAIKGGQVSPLEPIETRDERIKAVKEWLAADKAWAAHAAKETSALAGLPAEEQKAATELLKRLGVE